VRSNRVLTVDARNRRRPDALNASGRGNDLTAAGPCDTVPRLLAAPAPHCIGSKHRRRLTKMCIGISPFSRENIIWTVLKVEMLLSI